MDLEISNTPSVELEIGQANVVKLETGITKVPQPKPYMTYIDLSTDMENPTNVLDYIDKSGIYVAKNKGVIGFDRTPFTVLAPGQFFEIQNMKDLAEIIPDGEISDEDNEIIIAMPSIEGYTFYLRIKNNEVNDSVNITSANINDYVNIDTSNLITRGMINSAYGVQIMNNQLGITPASQFEIDTGKAIYKPITAERIDYAVRTKGSKYFGTKEDLQSIQDNVENLVTDISAILDTVVDINE